MTSFFCNDDLTSLPININAEYAYTCRKFRKKPIIEISTNYKSALFLTYSQMRNLPNRKQLYRNHFTMYLNRRDFEILICRSETTQVYSDNDAIIIYQRLTLSKDKNMRFTNNDIAEWAISFDKDIKYSSKKPQNFVDFEMLCSGEWWYFDRGIILNGITRYVPHENPQLSNENIDTLIKTCQTNALPIIANICKTLFIYYELYPEIKVTQPCMIPQTNSQTNNNCCGKQELPKIEIVSQDHLQFLQSLMQNSGEYTTFDSSNSKEISNNEPIKLSSIDSEIIPIVNNMIQKSISHQNENTSIPNIAYQNIMPSRFWFLERIREFKNNNIDYFTKFGMHNIKI